jgi:putative transposase
VAIDLERKLGEFQHYFNDARVHASLGAVPKEVAGESTRTPVRLDDFRWRAHCRGLVELPVAA